MLILGAGGHAKEVYDIIKNSYSCDLAFYDDVTPLEKRDPYFQKHHILKSPIEMLEWFKNHSNSFVLGVGGIKARIIMQQKALDCGGICTSFIADNAFVSSDSSFESGVNIMQMAFISNSVQLGNSVLINTRANIHHDVIIGDFSEIAPGAILLGKCRIGKMTFVGAGAIILPGVHIGDNCTIGAGAVVTYTIKDNQTVKGVPAR